jgi:hypothetical protein
MTLADHMREWFCGDDAAVDFALSVWHVAQEWDDLHDEGKADHNAALAWLAFQKDLHPFYARHAGVLHATLLGMFLDWTAANELERGSREDCDKALVLRAGFYRVCHVVALLTGGFAHAAKVGPVIWRQYGETAEGLWKEMQDA